METDRLRSIFESGPFVTWQIDLSTGRYHHISPQIVDLTGRPADYWVGPESWLAVVHPDDRDRMRAFLKRGPQPDGLPYVDYRMVHTDGRVLHVRGYSHRDPQHPNVLFGSTIDRTAEALALRRLHQSEERFRLAFETSPDSINLNRLGDGRYLDVSQGFLDIMGYSRDEVLGRTSLSLNIWSDPADRERMRALLTRDGYVENLEADFARKDGTIRRGLMSARIIELDGEPVILSITRDITRQRQAEREREQLERLRSLGTLAGGIAHDFNNILTAVTGNLSLLRFEGGLVPGAAEALDEAQLALHTATHLTRQLLTFASGGEPVREVVSLPSLVEQAARFQLSGSAVRLHLDVSPELWSVEVDPSQIHQVISNLVLNAREAMPQGGEIHIELGNLPAGADALPEPAVVIHVRDTGVGIAAEHLRRIFEPYFSTKQRGSGLGMAMVYSIVTRHRGQVRVRSEVGHCTEFTILLPASPGQTPLVASASPAAPAPERLSGLRVLVLDDEPSLRRLLVRMLERLGCQAEAVDDGAVAVARYAQAMAEGRRFDAVIMDLTVPGGVGGAQAIGELLELDPDVRAMVSSGYSADGVMSDFQGHGFGAALPKPHTLDSLRAAMITLLG